MGMSAVAEAAAWSGHDEVHALGDEPVDDGRAVGLFAAGVALLVGHGVAKYLGQRVLEALGRGVERDVGHLLADADNIGLAGGIVLRGLGGGGLGLGGVRRGRLGGRIVGRAAGGEREQHQGREQKGKSLFHFGFSFSILSGSKKAAPPVQTGLPKPLSF